MPELSPEEIAEINAEKIKLGFPVKEKDLGEVRLGSRKRNYAKCIKNFMKSLVILVFGGTVVFFGLRDFFGLREISKIFPYQSIDRSEIASNPENRNVPINQRELQKSVEGVLYKGNIYVGVKSDVLGYLVERGDTFWDIIKYHYGVTDTSTLNNVIRFNLERNKDPRTKLLVIDNKSVEEGVVVNKADGYLGDNIFVGQVIFLPNIKNHYGFTLENIVCNEKGFIMDGDEISVDSLGNPITVSQYVRNCLDQNTDIYKGAIRDITIRDEKGVSFYNEDGEFNGAIVGVDLENVISSSLIGSSGRSLDVYSLFDNDFIKKYFRSNGYVVGFNDFIRDLDNIADLYNKGGMMTLRANGYKGDDAYGALNLARKGGNVVKGSLRLFKKFDDSFEDLKNICSIYLSSDTNEIAIERIKDELGYKVSNGTIYRLLDLYQGEIGLKYRIRKSKMNVC